MTVLLQVLGLNFFNILIMREQILKLSKQFIEIPSVGDDISSLHHILKVAKKTLNGFLAKEFIKEDVPSAIYFNTRILPKKFKVLLNAHLDVLPGNKKQYKPFLKDSRLYGRGAIDMKAAGAVELLVFREVASQVNYPLGLQLVTDEETGGFKGVKHQKELGIDTEFVLAGESGSNFTLGTKAKGVIWLKIKFRGRSAHGAYPWLGDNALWKAHDFLEKINLNFPLPKNETWQTTVNLAKIETTNQSVNKVPDDATLVLDIRFVPGENRSVLEKIKKLLSPTTSLEILLNEPAHQTEIDNVYIRKLAGCVEKQLHKPAQLVGRHGGSDLRHFLGVPSVEFGPIGDGAHTDNEWVDIESLIDYFEILKEFLLSI